MFTQCLKMFHYFPIHIVPFFSGQSVAHHPPSEWHRQEMGGLVNSLPASKPARFWVHPPLISFLSHATALLPGSHPCSAAAAAWLFFSVPSSLPTSSSLILKTQLEPGHLIALLVTGQLRGPFSLRPFLLSCVSVAFSSFSSACPTAQ